MEWVKPLEGNDGAAWNGCAGVYGGEGAAPFIPQAHSRPATLAVVFGMPREAIAHGAADEVLPLNQIASALITRLRGATDRLHHRI